MKKRLKMKCKYFLFSFFSCPFSFSPSSFSILHLHFDLQKGNYNILLNSPVIFLSSFFHQKQHLSLTYSSLTFTIYEVNRLTHQASLKESICEEMFPITYIKIGVAPCQLISCQQQPHISKLQKMYLEFYRYF